MKKSKEKFMVMVALFSCVALSSCSGSKYSSHYSATKMVKSKTSEKASVSFSTFNGVYVMQLRDKSEGEKYIEYNAKIGEGTIKAYYDYSGEKLPLFEINDNQSLEGKRTDPFTSTNTIYITIESDDKCFEGSFSFTLKKS